jgi:iron complex outermembrane receptor protein
MCFRVLVWPINKVEVNTRAGVFNGEGFRWNVNAGSNFGKYYLQVGVSQLKQNFYPLSKDFEAILTLNE